MKKITDGLLLKGIMVLFLSALFFYGNYIFKDDKALSSLFLMPAIITLFSGSQILIVFFSVRFLGHRWG